jgi:hypothetical protein
MKDFCCTGKLSFRAEVDLVANVVAAEMPVRLGLSIGSLLFN